MSVRKAGERLWAFSAYGPGNARSGRDYLSAISDSQWGRGGWDQHSVRNAKLYRMEPEAISAASSRASPTTRSAYRSTTALEYLFIPRLAKCPGSPTKNTPPNACPCTLDIQLRIAIRFPRRSPVLSFAFSAQHQAFRTLWKVSIFRLCAYGPVSP